MEGSKWDEVLQLLLESDAEYKKISREHLVNFCSENKGTRSAAEDFLTKCQKLKGKDSGLALRKKEEGNEKYRIKEYKESLSLYTESIFLANKNDECLPLAYSNRSLVLHKLDCPMESLVDIDMALACGYPKKKLEILLLRKAKCLAQLGDIEKAKEVLTELLQKSEEKECHQLIKNELKKLESMKNMKNSNSENKLPEVVGGENENFISASKYLNVCYEKTKGRHVIAMEDIDVGDVLFVEKAFAFVAFKKCFNCAKNIIAPIPCWNCSDVRYCSPKCRDDFWKSVHSFECGFGKLFNSVGIAYLSLRIILKASHSLDELKQILKNISEPEYKNGIVIYRSKGYDAVYNLVHNFDKYETTDMFQYVMTALLLALYLKKHTNYFPKLSEEEDLKLLTSVITRHILQLICNGHAISDIFNENIAEKLVVNTLDLRIGTGIYVSASMMNHSCESNIINSFFHDCLIVRAAKPIKKGEEVFNCYGLDARRMSRANRQEILSKQYFFKCKCQACLQPYDIQDKFTAFKCANCKGPSIPRGENSLDTICINCGQTSTISRDTAKKFNDFYSLIEGGKDSCKECITMSLQKFLGAWWIGRNIFYKFHKDLSYVADEVAKCLVDLGDFRRSILFLKCCILSVEKRFGSLSIELAQEMKKLGDVILTYLTEDEQSSNRCIKDLANQGVVCYTKAHKIMTLLCGPGYNVSDEIKLHTEMLERLLKLNNKHFN